MRLCARFRISFLLLAGCLLSCLVAHAQQSGAGIVPVSPSLLLKALPSLPEPWRVTVSQGRHLPQTRPLAKATRTYVLQQQADPSKMIAVEITILDSAENAALHEKFSDPANPQKLIVDSMPAIRAPAAGETDRLELLAFNRFLITVAIKGETTAKGEEWIKRINLPALRTAASASGTFDPKKEFVFTVERIDEIDTRRTRSSKCSIAPEEEEAIVNSP